MLKKIAQLTLLLGLLGTSLTSCGTVAPAKAPDGGSLLSTAKGRTYGRVIVQNFRNTSGNSEPAAEAAPRMLANKLQNELLRLKPSAAILSEGKPDADTLVVSGNITRFVEGSAALRFWVGMGAGSSYFDATLRVTDGSGKHLGTINADKNSWGLGGAIAAGQTVETFMDETARKSAQQLVPLVR